MFWYHWMMAGLLLFSSVYYEAGVTDGVILLAEPGYAQWGKLAMEETSKVYPSASIVDYKYEGKHSTAAGHVEERFVLWLRSDSREFGVRVTISVEAASEKIIQVIIKEM